MKITADNISKKYNNYWVFKNFHKEFHAGKIYAILGANGSGKSTLVRCLIGYEHTTKGNIRWTDKNSTVIDQNKYFRYVSFCAPAQELIEEFTIAELLTFHFNFKPMAFTNSIEDIIDILDLRKHLHLPIRDYSSGMKQRVKLAQAFFSDTSIMCLDEPTSNLDDSWITFYQEYIKKTSLQRLVLIASNQEAEYQSAHDTIMIEDFKS